jgi:hydroxymethylpyrimidine pyrophosphatase-like HAD family hydrolase
MIACSAMRRRTSVPTMWKPAGRLCSPSWMPGPINHRAFQPKVVADFAGQLDDVAKLVGVGDDHDTVQRCEADAQAAFGQRATASRSQPYYLDITHKDANKGAVVEYLSRVLAVPTGEIATIGDQPNDVLMFKRSGFSIAMGNASDDVKAQAAAVTASYNDEGFAKAMENFILDGARQ